MHNGGGRIIFVPPSYPPCPGTMTTDFAFQDHDVVHFKDFDYAT